MGKVTILRHLILILILSSCTKQTPTERSGVAVWVNKNYSTCLMNQVNPVPFDLAITLNRSDIPRYDAMASFRPFILGTDGTVTEIGQGLLDRPAETSLQHSAWDTDGSLLLNRIWIDPQHAMLEGYLKDFLLVPHAYRSDVLRYSRDAHVNLTQGPNEVSFYNLNGQPLGQDHYLFTAFVNKETKTFIMNRDGSRKRPLLKTSGYAYGLNISPDELRYAFHSNYQVYIGVVESGIETHVKTPCNFNFGPVWSPDGSKIAFFCGNSDKSPDLYIADSDGSNVRFLGTRSGYSGSVPFTDFPDYHGGGSDRIAWTKDSRSVIYGRNIDGSTELVQKSLDGTETRLTYSPPDSRNVYPSTSRDGKYLVFHAKRGELPKQDTYFLDLETGIEVQVTDLAPGCNSRNGLFK